MPFEGFTLHNANRTGEAYLQYPQDPPMVELARAQLNDELLILFQSSWLAIVQPDETYVVTRMD